MTESLYDLQQNIRSSPGAVFIDRSHARSFSMNIFQNNANELIAATRQVSDPDQGLRLMSEANREAGRQVHREISRLVHNFVAGSMSLVDHTRVFVTKNYENTAFASLYNARVKDVFANEPIAKFIQDLRNYMLHNGLPDSEMFVHFDNRSDSENGGQLTTGVRFATEPLKNWDRWTAPARTYIEASGQYVDIQVFAEAYLKKVLLFQQWFDSALFDFHRNDLAQLHEMQQAYERLSAEADAQKNEKATFEPPSENLQVASPEATMPLSIEEQIEQVGIEIFARIRPILFASKQDDDFRSRAASYCNYYRCGRPRNADRATQRHKWAVGCGLYCFWFAVIRLRRRRF